MRTARVAAGIRDQPISTTAPVQNARCAPVAHATAQRGSLAACNGCVALANDFSGDSGDT